MTTRTEIRVKPLLLSPEELRAMRQAREETWRDLRAENRAWIDGFKAGATAVGILAIVIALFVLSVWGGWR